MKTMVGKMLMLLIILVCFLLQQPVSISPYSFHSVQSIVLYRALAFFDDNYIQHDIGLMDTLCPFCGAYHWIQECVTSSGLQNPQFEMCCQWGKIKSSLLFIPPQPLYNLFVDQSVEALDFRQNIVQYKQASLSLQWALTWTTLYLDKDHLSSTLSTMKICSPIHYSAFSACFETIYSQLYQHAHEVLKHYNGSDLSIKLCVLPGNDPCRYNEPTADEVGVILPGEEHQGDYCDIILHLHPQYWGDSVSGKKHLKLENINEGHPAYVPMHHVLLFLQGEPGWYEGLQIPESPCK